MLVTALQVIKRQGVEKEQSVKVIYSVNRLFFHDFLSEVFVVDCTFEFLIRLSSQCECGVSF